MVYAIAYPYSAELGPNIGPINGDGTQNISLYDAKLQGRKTYTAPKENIDEYLKVIDKGNKHINNITLGSTLAGAVVGLIGGKIGQAEKASEYFAASIAGALIFALVGYFASFSSASKNVNQARIDYIEKSQ